ncbi:g5414 [Coccomyxa viridis]|uniref:G5414 protein n=1 Tax=Coccomyxa viridis TaxID=1274662 RepID=A0ABP1FXP7_9CHLO
MSTAIFVACAAQERKLWVQCVEVKAPKDAEFGKESRIGKAPIKLPAGVTVNFDSDLLEVKGPKGQMSLVIPSMVEIRQAENTLRVFKTEESRTANCRHGLIRALASNMVTGVSEGWTKQLQLIGVGYRGTLNGNTLVLNLGFSHPVEMVIPEGIQVKVEKAINVTITGYDKEQVGQFAATIRQKRPPEPYKQKGVRYLGEYIRKKEGKRGK